MAGLGAFTMFQTQDKLGEKLVLQTWLTLIFRPYNCRANKVTETLHDSILNFNLAKFVTELGNQITVAFQKCLLKLRIRHHRGIKKQPGGEGINRIA
ncbi:hypothetical protein RGQ30_05670 [Limnobacter thiooxidans]|uniref:Uncharacterized protein n=1 Tax=Limnobacter thiooxidans TaxID=131080 RepID=A0AA86IZJ4_9BURK|nr:hypothetical protein RGQ30_05670 [Limnobacter thiooxidans]